MSGDHVSAGPVWDPRHYLGYADERARPFHDLMARVGARDPRRIVDLGCGPGNLTITLAERWPEAQVEGIDSSAEMIAAAPQHDRVHFEVRDLRDWAGRGGPVDLLVSNATLQWVPAHIDLLPALAGRVVDGGWIALQVPGNFGEPSHTIRAELAAEPPYAAHLADVAVPRSHAPVDYLRALAPLGFEVDAWETTYLHVLHGRDAVYEWVTGTGARPTLQALPDGTREQFAAEFRRRLAEAYPETGAGVVLPFRRIFIVGRRLG